MVARHAESELNVRDVLNGDPAVQARLTARGEDQARALGIRAGDVDVAAHTSFERTRRTAELAWPGAVLISVPEVDEIRFGRWEGTRWGDGYADWVRAAGPEEEVAGGGESRAAAARRYVQGYRKLLQRPEDRVALVAHGASVRYLLLAAGGATPVPCLEPVPPAEPFLLERDAVARAIDVLERWLESPAF